MAITLAQAQTALQNWIDADAAVATGQSYTIAGRTLTRANAKEITEKIQYWSKVEAQLQRLAAGKPRAGHSVVRFNK